MGRCRRGRGPGVPGQAPPQGGVVDVEGAGTDGVAGSPACSAFLAEVLVGPAAAWVCWGSRRREAVKLARR